MCGWNQNYTSIRNCYFKGTITGQVLSL
ncbi:MAG: hypothetical protein JW860_13330 [Sedimentisphaerales bacterium]|nr:hypothetical protein [Sedimentisphaerales bacterium]